MSHERAVFGVPIEGLSLTETLERIEAPREQGAFWIVTANPEILLAAKRDRDYAHSLIRANERMVDGFGLWILLQLSGHRIARVTGVELAEALLRLAAERQWKVAIIGEPYAGPDAAQRAEQVLRKRFPALDLTWELGGRIAMDGSSDQAGEEALKRLTMMAPDVVLVAFGHPKQERWIERNREAFPDTRAIVGIGGTIDFWAGTARRAPRWMRGFGLEWLWRLFIEPRRFRRIWNAVVVFPIAFLFQR